mgnify:CR=1 FL=1
MKQEIATHDRPPSPNTGRSTGHGEGIEYEGRTYYYRTPHWIPKDRISFAMREYSYRSRQRGDKEYVVIAPEGDHYIVLDVVADGILDVMKFYKDKTPQEAIAEDLELRRQIQIGLDAHPKCKCENLLIRFEQEQRDDECLECFLRRSKPSTSAGRGTGKEKRSATGRSK